MNKVFKKHKLKTILFVDLEMTCWENKSLEGFKEIIEIGVVSVDNVDKEIIDKKNYIITNEISEITPYCVNLTGISQEMINEEGIPLKIAFEQIQETFLSKNKTWFAWGCGDYNSIIQNSIKKNVENPFSDNYINLSELYALQQGVVRGKGLKRAIARHNIQYNGQQHRALVDAEATAELYLKVFRN